MRILAVDGSPTGPGRTRTVLDAVLEGASAAGATARVVELAEGAGAIDDAVAAASEADAFVLGSPVYRGSFAAPLKALLDRLPRGMWGETEAPITARAVAIVLTGASWHHYLALGDLRNVLCGFFGAHVLTPGLYVPATGFTEERGLTEDTAASARRQGEALVALATAIAGSPALQAVRPQA